MMLVRCPCPVEEFVIHASKPVGRVVERLLGQRGEDAVQQVTRASPLDGIHVWVTLETARPGRIVAVDDHDGDRTVFSPTVTDGSQTVLLPLAELPGPDERTWTLHFAPDRGPAVPLVRQDRPAPPTIAAPSPDERWHYRVSTRDAGLCLRRIAAEESIPVAVGGIGADEDQLQVAWSVTEGGEAVLRDGDHEPVPLSVVEDGHRAVASVAQTLALPRDTRLTVSVRRGDRWVPLRRAHNDLRRPNGAVLLPEITAEDHRTRFVWSGKGLLQVVRTQR